MKRTAFFLLLLLAACTSPDAPEDAALRPGWPSLAPRAGEISPLVPRVPLGACVGCTSGIIAPVSPSAMADLPLPQPVSLPADVEERLAVIDAELARIEAAWPAARTSGRVAIRSAGPGAAETEAEVQASRFEALFQPLGRQDSALTALEALLPDPASNPAIASRFTALRTRLSALDATRSGGVTE